MLELLNKSVIDIEKRELIESIIHPVREKRTMLGEYCDERYDLAKLSAPILLKRLEKSVLNATPNFPNMKTSVLNARLDLLTLMR